MADILIFGSWVGCRPVAVAWRNCSIIGGDMNCVYWLPTHRQRPSKNGGPEKITRITIKELLTEFTKINVTVHAHVNICTILLATSLHMGIINYDKNVQRPQELNFPSTFPGFLKGPKYQWKGNNIKYSAMLH